MEINFARPSAHDLGSNFLCTQQKRSRTDRKVHLWSYGKRRQQRRERVAAAKLIRAEWPNQITREKAKLGDTL
jgi:hypothetical protein